MVGTKTERLANHNLRETLCPIEVLKAYELASSAARRAPCAYYPGKFNGLEIYSMRQSMFSINMARVASSTRPRKIRSRGRSASINPSSFVVMALSWVAVAWDRSAVDPNSP